jgi:hypothetical protein
MGILDRIRCFSSDNGNKRDDSDFNLNDIKENLKKYREAHPKQPVKFAEWEKERVIDWKNDPLIVYGRSKDEKKTSLTNPTLLSVKMFLADVTQITNIPYDPIRHNCSDFSRDVQDAATKRGLRCGYVRLTSSDCVVGHAIVCFDTDHGLKYFEPQTTEEEDAVIGRRYSENVSHNEGAIDKIEIFWNDDVYTKIERPYPYCPE